MRIIAIIVLSALLGACSAFGAPAEGQMCEAAGRLSAAKTLVEQAAAKDAIGDRSGAQVLATGAATLAERAHDALQAIPSSEVKQGDIWQALLDAYLHIGQAANALLPGYENTYGSTAEELATGFRRLQAASAGLPSRCFTGTSSPAADGVRGALSD